MTMHSIFKNLSKLASCLYKYVFTKENGFSWKQVLSKAFRLIQNPSNIRFLKKSGEFQERTGVLIKSKDNGTTIYFDIEKSGIRSFIDTNLLFIEAPKLIEA